MSVLSGCQFPGGSTPGQHQSQLFFSSYSLWGVEAEDVGGVGTTSSWMTLGVDHCQGSGESLVQNGLFHCLLQPSVTLFFQNRDPWPYLLSFLIEVVLCCSSFLLAEFLEAKPLNWIKQNPKQGTVTPDQHGEPQTTDPEGIQT